MNKYCKSRINRKEAYRCIQKLVRLMETEKIYAEPGLDLFTLSKKLEISRHRLSQIINSFLKTTFYNYINRYRISDVKKNLEDPERATLNILDIAFMAGFSTKSSFNRIFKEHVKMSPSDYRRAFLQQPDQGLIRSERSTRVKRK